MRQKWFRSTVTFLALALITVSLLVPVISAESSAPLAVSAQGTAFGIGTPYEKAVIDLSVTNFYTDPLRNNTISPWVLQFDFSGEIQSVTGAVITNKEGNRYTLKGTTDTDVAYGETLQIRVEGTLGGILPAQFTNLTLRPEVIAVPWKWQGVYQVGDIVEYNGVYYKAIQAHTAHATNWTPPQTPALWKATSIETYSYSASAVVDLEIIESWALGATYTAGQIVFYNGQFFECVQSHTAHAPNWTPGPYTASLWKPAASPF